MIEKEVVDDHPPKLEEINLMLELMKTLHTSLSMPDEHKESLTELLKKLVGND